MHQRLDVFHEQYNDLIKIEEYKSQVQENVYQYENWHNVNNTKGYIWQLEGASNDSKSLIPDSVIPDSVVD